MAHLRVIPVLDVKDGRVVHAVGGRRAEYRPVRSRLTASSRPLDVAEAFRAQFGWQELYVADLDALGGGMASLDLFAELVRRGFRLWLDAGVRDLRAARQLAVLGVQQVVLALEALPGPTTLNVLADALGRNRLAFSLDLMGGRPMGELSRWSAGGAEEVAKQVFAVGIERLIVLDLAYVGGDGPGNGVLDLCSRLKKLRPSAEIVTGGGVRGGEDLLLLEANGVSAALVASALHDGRIRPEHLNALLS